MVYSHHVIGGLRMVQTAVRDRASGRFDRWSATESSRLFARLDHCFSSLVNAVASDARHSEYSAAPGRHATTWVKHRNCLAHYRGRISDSYRANDTRRAR